VARPKCSSRTPAKTYGGASHRNYQIVRMAETTEAKLFGKWAYDDGMCKDMSLTDYITVKGGKAEVFLPHTAQRYQTKCFRKAACPIAERMITSMMMHGRNNGKKVKAVRIMRQTLDIIHLLTGENPLEVLVLAVQNGGAREDSTKIGGGGSARRQAVDVSPIRRVNQSIYLITQGARKAAFRSIKTISECLADEIINCSKESSNSFAIKKKDEIERVAKANR